jgi:hypothetical protein
MQPGVQPVHKKNPFSTPTVKRAPTAHTHSFILKKFLGGLENGN